MVTNVLTGSRRCDGRSSTLTTDENNIEVRKIVLSNCRITIIEITEDLNISIGSCHFNQCLGMSRVAPRFVQKLLNLTKNSAALTLFRRCWTESATTQICSRRSWLVTNHGFMAMTWKPKFNHSNGNCRMSQDQKSAPSSVGCDGLAHSFLRL